MTALYDNLGIRFQYPENWQLAQEVAEGSPCEVLVETPGGGFWSVLVYPGTSDPDQLAAETLRTMRGEYEDLEAEPFVDVIGDFKADGFEMHFYCLDFVVTSRVLAFRHEDRTLLVLYQAETSEFDQLEQVFRAVTFSLQQPVSQ